MPIEDGQVDAGPIRASFEKGLGAFASRFASWVGSGFDRSFPALVLVVTGVSAVFLILPVPALLLDLLLGGNLLLGFSLLFLAARASDPRRLPFFPALLVLLVLLRLGLSVAALRLLLLQGEAGMLIDLFGRVVAGGDAVIGVVLLLVLALTQYLVIARGGERVAEVAARFSLDALPGQQAAIDADLRSGAISPSQAQGQRAALLHEAQIYGAMDGALRFVKGDVITGLLVLAIALLGGVGHGLLSEGLSPGEALGRYALLTTGLGLCTQLPVLLTAVAAGLLLTRGVQRAPEASATQAEPLPPPPKDLLIVAGPGLGLSEGAVAAMADRLRERLGIPLSRPAFSPSSDGDRLLQVSLRGARLLSLRVAPEEAPLALARIEEALCEAAPELLGVAETQRLLDELLLREPTLLRETVPRKIELPLLLQVLRRLLAERVLPLPLQPVLDAIAALSQPETDALLLTEQVRGLLGRHLLQNYLSEDGGLLAFTLDLDLEDALREALREGPGGGESLAIEPALLSELHEAAARARGLEPGAVLLCHRDVRRHVARLLLERERTLPVLAFSELPPLLSVTVVGRIGPGGLADRADLAGENGGIPQDLAGHRDALAAD